MSGAEDKATAFVGTAVFIFFALLGLAYAVFYNNMSAFDKKQQEFHKRRMKNKRYALATNIAQYILSVVILLVCFWGAIYYCFVKKQYILVGVFGILSTKFIVTELLYRNPSFL